MLDDLLGAGNTWPAAIGAGSLLGVLALLFGLGALLSRLERNRLGAPTEGRGLSRWSPLHLLYEAVLWLGVCSFYLLFPAMVALSVLFAYLVAGVAWEMVSSAHYISIRALIALFMVVVGAALGVLAVVLGLFPPRGRSLPVLSVGPAQAPELFRALDEAAKHVRTPGVAVVELGLLADVHVRQTGSGLRVFLGLGQRVIYLGLPALRGLTVSQLKAILVHELGHFSHGDTRIGPVLAGVMNRIATMRENYQSLGVPGLANPVYWYLSGYDRIFRLIALGMSRRMELLADLAAASAHGGGEFASALTRVEENGVLHGRYGFLLVDWFRGHGLGLANLDLALDALERELGDDWRQELARDLEQLHARTDGSHPPTPQRIAAVRGVTGPAPDLQPWHVLLPDRERVQAELTKLAAGVVEAARGADPDEPVAPALRPLPPQAEAALAVAAIRHLIVAARFEQRLSSPEALEAAVEDLVQAAAEVPTIAIEATKQLSFALIDRQRLAEAARAVDRALALTNLLPGGHLHRLELEELKRTIDANRQPGRPALPGPAPLPAIAQPSRGDAAGQAPTGDLPPVRCEACGSASPGAHVLRHQRCQWCGASIELRQPA